jgi:hypothetical protein
MKSKTTQILFHVIGCLIFLTLPIIFMPGPGDVGSFLLSPRSLREILHTLLILLFFYFNYYLLIPRLYFTRKYTYFVLAVVACFFIVVLLPNFIYGFGELHDGPMRHPFEHKNDGGHVVFAFTHNLLFFLAVTFFSIMLRVNNRLRQTEKEKLDAELMYFKAQINPHFLFNTLNSIYSLALQKDDNTPEAVVKLSGMMRYVLTDASENLVPLHKEIVYISDFIELQKIRYGETVTVNFRTGEFPEGIQIAPLILIPFIENAFKFGINPEENSAITIEIDATGKELHMKVVNFKVNLRREKEHAGGLGIENARRRLGLIYPEKHRLIINDNGKYFTVDLFIDLS